MTKPERIILVLGIAIFLAGLGIYLAFLGPSHLLKVGGKTYSDSTDKTIDSGRRILDGVARRVSKAFNLTPTQQINGRIIVESSVPILELATLSQELTASSTHTQTWLYSSKVVEVQNGYRVKAGFNINRSFTLNYETDGKRLLVRLPPPEILSVEAIPGHLKIKTENGLINRVADQDTRDAIEYVNKQARQDAIRNGMLSEAQKSFESKMIEFARLEGIKNIQFLYGELPVEKSPKKTNL